VDEVQVKHKGYFLLQQIKNRKDKVKMQSAKVKVKAIDASSKKQGRIDSAGIILKD
jgi:hypothetical protein